MKTQSDPRVVRRAQGGDRQAIEAVAGNCRELFRRTLGKRGITGEAQEEIIHEAIALLLRKLPEFRGEARLETWALAIAFRVAQRYFDRQATLRERVVLESEMSLEDDRNPWEQTPGGPEPEEEAMRNALRDALADCLSRIAVQMREVWVRHRMLGMAHHEISEALDIKIDTVGTRIYRVDGKMRTCLEKKGFTAQALGAGR